MPDVIAVRAREWLASGRLGAGMVAASMLAAAVLGTIGLSNHKFWDDEANTAVYARNLLDRGEFTAWDGTNLLSYAYGGGLGEDLGRELRVPGLSACVAALGICLFGPTTFGGRILFVIAGVLSVGLLAVWVRRHFSRRFPWWLPSLILALSPAYLLYIRNCRYYALAVLFTLLVWTVWAPGRRMRETHRLRDGGLHPPYLLRYAAAAVAMVLLLSTHYLSAAAVLATLPLFFFDRRYRQPQQYVLLGVFYATAAAYGVWVLATANPFGTGYLATEDWLMPYAGLPDRWAQLRHAWWLVRDLGTHEFLPWCLVPVLAVPWLPAGWLPTGTRRLRPAASGGLILLGLTLAYALTAALLTPSDMGKGPIAEMRYVVPLLAVGATIGGVAVAMLWRLSRPAGAAALVLLLGTNFLHLGCFGHRYDGTSSWWPPTPYRYVHELFHDYQTGNEELIALLKELPPGTTVRTWPVYMTHPGIFYRPELHYCDQLTEAKPLSAELRAELPAYVYVERAEPEVVLVPAPFIRPALARLRARFGDDSYHLCKALSGHWNYTSKPELSMHSFQPSQSNWQDIPGLAVLVATGSPLEGHGALETAPDDAAGHHRLGKALAAAGQPEKAAEHYAVALKLNPDYEETYLKLGNELAERGLTDDATVHYAVVLQANPDHRTGFLQRANALVWQQTPWLAMPYFRAILQIDEDDVAARGGLTTALVDMARSLAESGRTGQAIRHYREALELVPKDSVLAGKIELSLRRLEEHP